MATYTGPTFKIEKPAQEIAAKFDDLSGLQSMVDKVPADQLDKVGKISFDVDSLSIETNQLGTVKFKVSERSDNKVVMISEGTPVPIELNLNLQPEGTNATDVTCAINLDIPTMLKPMIAPHMHKAVEMLSDMIKKSLS